MGIKRQTNGCLTIRAPLLFAVPGEQAARALSVDVPVLALIADVIALSNKTRFVHEFDLEQDGPLVRHAQGLPTEISSSAQIPKRLWRMRRVRALRRRSWESLRGRRLRERGAQ